MRETLSFGAKWAAYWDALHRIRDLGDRDANLQGKIGELEADLAATRDRLRQAESEQDRMEHREQELQAIIAATGFEKDELRAKASAAEARASEANHRATRIALDAELKSQLEQAQARIAELEAERDAADAGREGRRRMPMPKTGPSAVLDQSDADNYYIATELRQAQARIAALEQEAERLRWTVRNIRLTAALGRSFGHQATPQTPEKMSERKDKALDKVLGFCADAGETGSILREAQADARGREKP